MSKAPTRLPALPRVYCSPRTHSAQFVERKHDHSPHLQNVSYTSAAIRPSNPPPLPQRKYHCPKTNKLNGQVRRLSLDRLMEIGCADFEVRDIIAVVGENTTFSMFIASEGKKPPKKTLNLLQSFILDGSVSPFSQPHSSRTNWAQTEGV